MEINKKMSVQAFFVCCRFVSIEHIPLLVVFLFLFNQKRNLIQPQKAFRSNVGVAQKLIKAVTEQGENLTSGLMTSGEAHATKRGLFTQWSHMQIASGKYQTELKEVISEDEAIGNKVVL
ncbi:MAG: hypothetical protein KKD01_14955 [Proteobacteria bacterium]|nr:hypothetical protein [Pseudomonadota bacterium]MBU1233536.1 hypothetical protein [Pseudomonadota bacterium]MBU1418661.1 hypothetical protein [Pseudomonadota bacterium]MBU1456021.1 hypothetical protein [Pseudomonadota bacterium]